MTSFKSFSGFFLPGLMLATLALAVLTDQLTANADNFADNSFQNLWNSADAPVANGQASRSWLWGAGPNWSGYERYSEGQGGQRLVQYFDKSRMEINNPGGNRNDPYYVTNGLLTVELVTGKMQVGNNAFESRSPARMPVAGDPQNNPGPSYAAMTGLTSMAGNFYPSRQGNPVTQTVDGTGRVGEFGSASPYGQQPPMWSTYAYYEASTRHNIPDVFWNWMQNIPGTNWVFALGYPITEPYWSRFTVGGQQKLVLTQLFERRALTYTPDNQAAFKVEMGNIGQHYFTWRNNNQVPAPPFAAAPPPVAVAASDNEEQTFVRLVNDFRRSKGLGVVTQQVNLEQAATWMAQDMAEKNYFSHVDSMGRDPFRRMTDFGYTGGYKGENLAAGNGSAQEALNQWIASPPHYALLITAQYKSLGIARYNKPGSAYGWYWALNFGG